MIIPIPETPQSEPPDLAFEFVDREKDGLPEFKALEDDPQAQMEAHIIAFRKVDDKAEDCQWAMAAVAASFTRSYGKGEVKEFAEAIKRSPSRVWHIARTYRTFTVGNCSREQNLSFKHHEIAASHTRPQEALEVAKAQDMACLALQAWVSEQSLKRASKAMQKAKRAVRNDFKEHLLHMDAVIREDFIKLSPNQAYAKRVCSEWLVEIADEIRQIGFAENRERVIDAIDERGGEDEKAIRKLTGLPAGDVTRIVGQLIAEGLYEMNNKGGKTDVASGSPSKILHKVGTSDGGAFNVHRTETRYAH
jgi:hypothetical protein